MNFKTAKIFIGTLIKNNYDITIFYRETVIKYSKGVTVSSSSVFGNCSFVFVGKD